MTSEEPPPMPAAPPPSHEPPAPVPVPPAPTPTSGPIVDRVPGSPPPAPGGLILPSDLPTWAPAPPAQPAQPAQPAGYDPDAGDTIPVSSFLLQNPEPAPAEPPAVTGQPAPAEPAGPPTIPGYAEAPAPEWAADTQRAWPTSAEAGAISPPSEFASPPGFAPAGFGGVPTGPAPGQLPGQPSGGPGLPPGGSRSHASPASGGKGKLAALVAGIVVLLALLGGGGYALFHSSSKKTPVALPTPEPPVASSEAPSEPPTPTPAPTSAAPSPTVDANLGGMQAKVLQSTVVGPLKNLITEDLHVASATDACVGLTANAKVYDAHVAVRQGLLAQLRKLDVTGMQDYKTWKGLLEQVELKNISFEQQLSAYAKALEKSCDPATSTKNTHYQQALAIAKASGKIQASFLASYNPVAKRYNIPMQSRGNL